MFKELKVGVNQQALGRWSFITEMYDGEMLSLDRASAIWLVLPAICTVLSLTSCLASSIQIFLPSAAKMADGFA